MFILSYTTIYFFVKNCFFFSNVYTSVNTIFESSYFFWLKIRRSIKYVHNWRNGEGVIQNVYRCVQGEGGWKIGHKIRTYKTDWSKQMLWIFLCIGSAKYARTSPQARKMLLFSSIIITIIWFCAIIRV